MSCKKLIKILLMINLILIISACSVSSNDSKSISDTKLKEYHLEEKIYETSDRIYYFAGIINSHSSNGETIVLSSVDKLTTQVYNLYIPVTVGYIEISEEKTKILAYSYSRNTITLPINSN